MVYYIILFVIHITLFGLVLVYINWNEASLHFIYILSSNKHKYLSSLSYMIMIMVKRCFSFLKLNILYSMSFFGVRNLSKGKIHQST